MSEYDGEDLPLHIPDEYIAAWRTQPVETLISKLDRLEQSGDQLSTQDSSDRHDQLVKWLRSYIQSAIRKNDIDLDTFL